MKPRTSPTILQTIIFGGGMRTDISFNVCILNYKTKLSINKFFCTDLEAFCNSSEKFKATLKDFVVTQTLFFAQHKATSLGTNQPIPDPMLGMCFTLSDIHLSHNRSFMKDLEHCSEMNVTFTEESSSFHIQTTINDSLGISNKGNEIHFKRTSAATFRQNIETYILAMFICNYKNVHYDMLRDNCAYLVVINKSALGLQEH